VGLRDFLFLTVFELLFAPSPPANELRANCRKSVKTDWEADKRFLTHFNVQSQTNQSNDWSFQKAIFLTQFVSDSLNQQILQNRAEFSKATNRQN